VNAASAAPEGYSHNLHNSHPDSTSESLAALDGSTFCLELCISTCNALTLDAAPAGPFPSSHLNLYALLSCRTVRLPKSGPECEPDPHPASSTSNSSSTRPPPPLGFSPTNNPFSSGRFTASLLVTGTSTCNRFGVFPFYYCCLLSTQRPRVQPPAPSKAPGTFLQTQPKTAGNPGN
jgi:hypothetical protein